MSTAPLHSFDAILDRFDQLWSSGSEPDLATFVRTQQLAPSDATHVRLASELIRIDLEYRWRAFSRLPTGSPFPWRVEDYRQQFGSFLAGDLTPLLADEFHLRHRFGDRPDIREYDQRFPTLADRIRREVAMRFPDLRRIVEVPLPAGDSTISRDTTGAPGLLAGRYERQEVLAQGGVGVVTLARDHEVNRTVALKQLKDEYADDPKLRGYFIAEAEITARLDHPAIVPVYGAGADGNGRPFYATRFVKGQTLLAAIDQLDNSADRRRDQKRLLARFVAVCAAIEYAHERGVIHCDLKPDNIMLGRHNETIVFDWGMATAVSTSISAMSIVWPAGLNQGSPLGGSLRYMSPEQARNERAGPAIDVFSLGATLYHVLTGVAPLSDRQAAEHCDFLPPRRRRPDIPPALEAICLQAMARQPSHRYASAAELGDDVERWLNDEPVHAYRESRLERVERWTRRHRSWTVSGVVALLVITCAALLSLWAVSRARWDAEQHRQTALSSLTAVSRARWDAEQHRQTAHQNLLLAREAVDTLLTEVGKDSLANIPQFEEIRSILLEKAMTFYERFRVASPTDPRSRLEVARARHAVADIDRLRGRKKEAQEAYEKAIAELTALVQEFPQEAEYRRTLGTSLNWLGVLQKPYSPHTACQTYDQAVFHRQHLLSEYPTRPEYAVELGQALYNRGIAYAELGRTSEALNDYTQSRSLLQNAVQAALTTASVKEANEYRQHLARVETNMGNVMAQQGKLDEAVAYHRQAISLGQVVLERYPERRDVQKELAAYYNNLANVLLQQETFSDAAQASDSSVRHLDHLVTPLPSLRDELANACITRGVILELDKNPEQAKESYLRAIPILESLEREFPRNAQYLDRLGIAISNYARCQVDTQKDASENTLRDIERAIALHRRASEINEQNADYRRHLLDDYAIYIEIYLIRKEHRLAASHVQAFRELDPKNHETLIWAADFLSKCCALAMQDATLMSDRQTQLCADYGRRSRTLLSEAIAQGLPESDSRVAEIRQRLEAATQPKNP